MKFVHYLERITGVSIYPLTSLMMFFMLFLLLTIWAFKAGKGYIHMMKHIPLADGSQDQTIK